MELIPHEVFGRLRLADFAPRPKDVVALEGWEFLERSWVGEAVGFTEWLRPVEEPDVLGALSLHLADLPVEVSRNVFDVLRLPLARGIGYDEVVSELGKPANSHEFMSGQASYEFRCGARWPYLVDCTIRDRGGVSYVTVVADG